MKKQTYKITFLMIVTLGLFLAQQSLAQTVSPISPFVFTTPTPSIKPTINSSTFRLPILATTSASNFVKVNTSGTFILGEVPAVASTTPGGSNTQVQVNQNNTFAGYPTFTFNSSTGLLDIASVSSTNALFINASSTNLFASALTFTTANGTSITSTNAFFTNLGTTNFTATNLSATNLTSTNANITGLIFSTASGTSITSTNINASLGQVTQLGVNSSSPIAQLSVVGTSVRNPVKVMSSTGAQLFAVNTNGQVVVGPNDLLQTGALTIQSQPGNDITLSFTDAVSYTFQLGKVAGTSGRAFIGGPFGTALALRAGGVDRVLIRNDNGYFGIGTTTPQTEFVVVGTSTITGLTIFNTATGTSITSTNSFISNAVETNLTATNATSTNLYISNLSNFAGLLNFSTASGTSITSTNGAFTTLVGTNLTTISATSTNLYVSSKAMIGTTTNTYALNVGGYGRFDRIYTEYASSYITGDTAGMVHVGGNFTNSGGYIYGTGTGVSIYSQNNLSVRGSILKDNAAFLSITGGTSGITYLTSKVGINTSTPTTELQVTALASNTTSTLTVGKAGQNKGSCLELYDAGGTAVYAYVAAGATAFTLSNTSCK